MLDAYDEIMNNQDGDFGDDVDNWETSEGWEKKEKEKFDYAVGEKEQLSLSTRTVKILADIRDRQGR